MFLKVEVVRNYSILANFQKEDFDLFKVRKKPRNFCFQESCSPLYEEVNAWTK
jgi:hypothetical protein